jgi:HAMP domain-containing protein
MENHDQAHFENRIKELLDNMKNAADEAAFREFIATIRKPGFTTPAEIALLRGALDSMLEQSKVLLGLKQVLISGASKVELNPQPLPPKVGRAGSGASG